MVRKERVEKTVGAFERNWLIKVIVIFAALSGVTIFFLELWERLHH